MFEYPLFLIHNQFTHFVFLKEICCNLELKVYVNSHISFENYFSSLSTKTYVVGAQKNHVNEMVL